MINNIAVVRLLIASTASLLSLSSMGMEVSAPQLKPENQRKIIFTVRTGSEEIASQKYHYYSTASQQPWFGYERFYKTVFTLHNSCIQQIVIDALGPDVPRPGAKGPKNNKGHHNIKFVLTFLEADTLKQFGEFAAEQKSPPIFKHYDPASLELILEYADRSCLVHLELFLASQGEYMTKGLFNTLARGIDAHNDDDVFQCLLEEFNNLADENFGNSASLNDFKELFKAQNTKIDTFNQGCLDFLKFFVESEEARQYLSLPPFLLLYIDLVSTWKKPDDKFASNINACGIFDKIQREIASGMFACLCWLNEQDIRDETAIIDYYKKTIRYAMHGKDQALLHKAFHVFTHPKNGTGTYVGPVLCVTHATLDTFVHMSLLLRNNEL